VLSSFAWYVHVLYLPQTEHNGLAQHTQMEKQRFRLQVEDFTAPCGKLVVFSSFGNMLQGGVIFRGQLVGEMQPLLSAQHHASAGQGMCIGGGWHLLVEDVLVWRCRKRQRLAG